MARWIATLLLVIIVAAYPTSTPACSLCASPLKKETLGQELDRANLIFFGYAANPKLNGPGAVPGAGTTDFHIEKIVKNDPVIAGKKVVTLERYVPVLDPKDPPRFLIFCDVANGKLDPYLGRQTKSAAVVDYLEAARPQRAKGKLAALQYYARFLDHADALIAEDAFLEFARSTDEEVGKIARTLAPEKFRVLLRQPDLDADRLSLFAFLLGNCGAPSDAAFLRERIDHAKAEEARALDGLLGGYIALDPREGWKLTLAMIANPKNDFLTRFSAQRTIRFYMGWKPAETRPHMLAAYKQVIQDGEMADLAVEDLRRWQTWDLTALVLAQYGKATHTAPIVRRAIVRYAIACPLDEAKEFLRRIGRVEGDLIRELTESLEFEKKN